MNILSFIFYLYCFIATVYSELGIKFFDPVGSRIGWGFQGQLWENTSTVRLTPELRSIPIEGISKSMSICGYTVHHEGVPFLPFVVLVVDQRLGYAEIKLKSNMDRNSLKSVYQFQVEAYDCDPIPHFSERKYVLVEMMLSHRPIFTKSSYHFMVKVDTPIGTEIGSVTAFERPEGSRPEDFSEGICKYTIVSDSPVPFHVSEYGVITIKKLVLDNVKSLRYRFVVRAHDCSKPVPRTSEVPVMVDVFDNCKPHWTGLISNIDYDGDAGVVSIVLGKSGAPVLHVCSDSCQNMRAEVNITLQGLGTRPASPDLCKRDDLSLIRQERLCDVSTTAMDMIKLAPASIKNLDNGGYYFPGNVAVPVNPSFDHVLARKFTIMFWMRHAGMEVKGVKEQILCNTDGQDQNRHHFSLFLHNCKLILLMRKEYGNGSPDKYDPSEWRFGPLKEVCDDKWHHFSVMFNDGAVFVQIDGELTNTSVEHLDDIPLDDYSGQKRDTVFTVGACYHAKSHLSVQYFKGHLASVKVLNGALEAINNIRCIATCGEALLLPHVVDVIGTESSVTLYSDSVVIHSQDIFNLLKMFSELSYINTEITDELRSSEMAKRTVAIDATIHCDGKTVTRASPRTIIINLRRGKDVHKPKNVAHIRVETRTSVQGHQNERIPIFLNLKFIKENGSIDSVKSCMIRPVDQSIQSWEYIDWPIDKVIDLHLTGLNNTYGLVVEGRQPLHIYESVLTKMYYVTRKDLARKFAISCSIIDSLVTEEVVVSITVARNDMKTYYVVDDPNETEEDNAQVLHQHGQGHRAGFQEKQDNVPNIALKKGTSKLLLWTLLPSLLIVVVIAMLAGIVYYRRQIVRHSVRLKMVASVDKKVRPCDKRYDATTAGDEDDDNDSLTNDLPDSDSDSNNDEEGRLQSSNIEVKDRIMIPSFRLKSGSHMRSVDV